MFCHGLRVAAGNFLAIYAAFVSASVEMTDETVFKSKKTENLRCYGRNEVRTPLFSVFRLLTASTLLLDRSPQDWKLGLWQWMWEIDFCYRVQVVP